MTVRKFGDEVQSKAQTDMNALGIQIISCNIQRVTDENSLINSLGQDNMSKIQKDAAIAKAEAERDIAIAQAPGCQASKIPGWRRTCTSPRSRMIWRSSSLN